MLRGLAIAESYHPLLKSWYAATLENDCQPNPMVGSVIGSNFTSAVTNEFHFLAVFGRDSIAIPFWSVKLRRISFGVHLSTGWPWMNTSVILELPHNWFSVAQCGVHLHFVEVGGRLAFFYFGKTRFIFSAIVERRLSSPYSPLSSNFILPPGSIVQSESWVDLKLFSHSVMICWSTPMRRPLYHKVLQMFLPLYIRCSRDGRCLLLTISFVNSLNTVCQRSVVTISNQTPSRSLLFSLQCVWGFPGCFTPYSLNTLWPPICRTWCYSHDNRMASRWGVQSVLMWRVRLSCTLVSINQFL